MRFPQRQARIAGLLYLGVAVFGATVAAIGVAILMEPANGS